MGQLPAQWVIYAEILPPVWTATHRTKSNEIALGNENCVARPPLEVHLQKGWNKVLLKLPVGKFVSPEVRLVKWMFTTVFVTLDGQKVMLYANIGNIKDLATVIQNDAGGIGLFRSEFIYLEKEDFPTEEEQFQAYKQAVQMMAGKKVIIRTLDIGADKQVDYFNLGNEDNPAMGYRAIRICLRQPEIFKTQLRALLRAAVYGNLSIMYPMITSTEEVKKIYEIVAEVEEELKAQEIQYKIPEQGIMIETPAAAIISDKLAEMVDFFSIGTNDLTQYTLAIDRQNAKLDNIYDSHHPAILKMLKMIVDNGHKGGCWVGICGELGADTTLTETFLSMGYDELSVSPSMILKVRQEIRSLDLKA